MFTSFAILQNARTRRVRNENYYKKVRLIRTNLRNRVNILELPEPLFLENFRLTKEAFLQVVRLLDLPNEVKSTHVTPILQLAATLNVLGGCGYQRQVGADWAAPMGQSTVYEISVAVIKK